MNDQIAITSRWSWSSNCIDWTYRRYREQRIGTGKLYVGSDDDGWCGGSATRVECSKVSNGGVAGDVSTSW